MSADLRAEFEAWIVDVEGWPKILLDRQRIAQVGDGARDYLSAGTQHRWLAYQAAARATARRCAEIAQGAQYSLQPGMRAHDAIKSEFPEAFGEG